MKAVKVKWIDSHEIGGWVLIDELPKPEKKIINTIGWLVRKNKIEIVVACSLGPNPPQVCGTICIPTEAILGIEELENIK